MKLKKHYWKKCRVIFKNTSLYQGVLWQALFDYYFISEIIILILQLSHTYIVSVAHIIRVLLYFMYNKH